jgi:hypothetical protein
MGITDIIAFLALLLSSFSLYLQWREKRPLLKVEATQGKKSLPILSDRAGGFVDVAVPVLYIYLSNPKEKEVRLSKYYILPKRGLQIEMKPFSPISSVVGPGRRQEPVIRGKELFEDLTKQGISGDIEARIEIQDEVGNRYKAKGIKINVQELEERL